MPRSKHAVSVPEFRRTARPSTYAFALLTLGLSGGLAALIDSVIPRNDPDDIIMRRQVAEWSLTDLALHTEARYTRHPSQADWHSAFQDHPGALEHFPSGSMMPPPPHIVRPTP